MLPVPLHGLFVIKIDDDTRLIWDYREIVSIALAPSYMHSFIHILKVTDRFSKFELMNIKKLNHYKSQPFGRSRRSHYTATAL